jgi:hypothetical protein
MEFVFEEREREFSRGLCGIRRERIIGDNEGESSFLQYRGGGWSCSVYKGDFARIV